jgi:hypothetical protein
MREINHIVIHHSASPLATTAQDIEQWHLAKGWNGAGYHLICEKSGELVLGRPIGVIGAHARPWNRNSIGICLVGDNTKPEESWREAQIKSLEEILRTLLILFPLAEVLGHRDLPRVATECPGLDVRELLGIPPA